MRPQRKVEAVRVFFLDQVQRREIKCKGKDDEVKGRIKRHAILETRQRLSRWISYEDGVKERYRK